MISDKSPRCIGYVGVESGFIIIGDESLVLQNLTFPKGELRFKGLDDHYVHFHLGSGDMLDNAVAIVAGKKQTECDDAIQVNAWKGHFLYPVVGAFDKDGHLTAVTLDLLHPRSREMAEMIKDCPEAEQRT
jgi:hypothetical protein